MTLATVVLIISLAALLLTGLTHALAKRTRNLGVSLLQNFCGAWFLFSGYVKVADPLGTAYKMEQYFDEFGATAVGAGLGALEGLFEFGSSISIYVAMFMVVLEVVLGVMLITGTRPRFTAYAFGGLMVAFTVLTGFTFLTGYVPTESNFFSFSEWGAFAETNMRVTDCGCFGDFLKLNPYTSFLKDCFLLVPAAVFAFATDKMHQLWTPAIRQGVSWASVAAASLFGVSNFVWDLPIHDFRPFREGVNIRDTQRAEAEAAENVEIVAWGLTNKASGERTELPNAEFMERYAEFPKDEFDYEQIQSEPAIPRTKVSDFQLEDADGVPVTDELLDYSGYSMMVVAYALHDDGIGSGERTVRDSMFITDTLADGSLRKTFAMVQDRSEVGNITRWDPAYAARWRERIVPFADAAEARGWRVFGATAYTSSERVDDFRHAVQFAHSIYEGDDIMLKTILRSNPGVVILKDGEVVKKFHVAQLPTFEEVAAQLPGQPTARR